VLAELFGREGGCASGRAGSMRLLDVGRNMLAGWGIVGSQLPIATGVSLALVQQCRRRRPVLCEVGRRRDRARVQQACFDDLDSPIRRVGMAEVPMPYAKNLESAPDEDKIVGAALATLG
jgi:hypothetical protein